MPTEILLIDLLGGIGDLVMVLPAVHALARRHPQAALRVLTHAPGAELLRTDPAVAEVVVARRGAETDDLRIVLDRHRPGLVVSTTRHSDIPAVITAATAPYGARTVTDLWRRPPADEPVSGRYLRILAEEGLVDPGDAAPAVHLTADEHAAGDRLVAALAPDGAPLVVVPAASMAVKRWPRWPELADTLAARGRPVLVVGSEDLPPDCAARPVPPLGLRELAAFLAAAGRVGGTVTGPDTGPVRLAAAVGAPTVALFGPTAATRYGLGPPAVDLQGLPDCPHRRPTAITDQVCWWDGHCPLSDGDPACMLDLSVDTVDAALTALAPR
jgi:heptosyltransferase-2